MLRLDEIEEKEDYSLLDEIPFITINEKVFRLLKEKIGIASSSRVSSEQHQTISGGIAAVEI